MGISHGEVDEIVEIKAGDRTVWKYNPSAPPLPSLESFEAYADWLENGDGIVLLMPSLAKPAYEYTINDRLEWPEQITSSKRIPIKAARIFGGDDGEGGIDGLLDVMMGEPTQPVNPRLQQMLGGLVPAYRGRTTLFFDGLICSMSKYPKAWAVKPKRNFAGWDGGLWYSSKAQILLDDGKIRARNPAHIIYECLTNRMWGRGFARAKLDDASFRACADVLFAENFGMCIRWARQDTVSDFIYLVQNHIGANVFPSHITGLWTLRLVREDYDVDTIPHFDADSGLLSIELDENADNAKAVNELTVNYTRPEDNSEGSVRVFNSAAIRANGLIPDTVTYVGLPTPELALRVGQRDLRSKFGLKKFKVVLDRRGYKIEPGGVFSIAAPERGIEKLVLRAGKIDDGKIDSGSITIAAVMDVFGLPANSYVGVQESLYTPPNFTPQPVDYRSIGEATYRDLVAVVDSATFNSLTPGTNFLTAMAASPNGLSYGYQMDTNTGGSWLSTDCDFTPTAVITSAIPLGAEFVNVDLDELIGMDAVSVGSVCKINSELFRVISVKFADKFVRLARGCVDTVPVAHAAGSRIWFYQDGLGVDTTEYAAGVSVDVRLLTKTGAGRLSGESAATDTYVMGRRRERPYPPGNLKINGGVYPEKISGALSVSWAHRDRTLQADQLIDATVGNVGPEPGTTYSVTVYGDGILVGSSIGSGAAVYSLALSDERGAGLLQLPRTMIMRSTGLASVTSTESSNLDPYPPESAGNFTQHFAKVNGGWLTFNNVGTTVRGVYVDSTTGAKTTRNFDLITNTRVQIVTLIPSVPKLDPTAIANQSFNGWATYWSLPGDAFNGYVNDLPGLFSHPPFKDRRANPSHIVMCNYAFGGLSVSAQTNKDIRRLNYISYALYVVQKAAVQTGPMAVSRTDIESYWMSTANQFDSLAGTADSVPPYLPTNSLMSAYNAHDLVYETGVIFGELLYVHYHRGTGAGSTSGKALDITNVVSSGHINYKTGAELVTKVYTISSAGALAVVSTRTGFYLADQLNSTQGFEVEYASRQVRLVNSTTGALWTVLGTLGYDPAAVYGDTVNQYIYILGVDGTLRKYDNTLTLLASIAVGSSDRALPFKIRRSDIKESANVLYVRFAGGTYEVSKTLTTSRPMTGYAQTFPGYANPSSSVILAYNGDQGLADENGLASTVFNTPKPAIAGSLDIEVSATRDGLTSFQKHTISTKRCGYGLRYGFNYRF